MKNYYAVLGLNNSATSEEIRRAYRTLARRYHPDVNPGQESSDKFKLISEAYRTLQDTIRRKDYDIKLELHERIQAEEKLRAYASKFKQRNRTTTVIICDPAPTNNSLSANLFSPSGQHFL